MQKQNTRMAVAQAARRKNEIAVFKSQHLRANQTGIRHPADHRHRDVKTAQTRPENGDNRQHQHQKRKCQHHINHPHKEGIDRAAEITGECADERAEDERKDDANQADLQIHPRAPHHPRENVAPKIISAKRMCQIRRQQRRGGVLRNRVVRRNPRAEQRHQNPHQQHTDPQSQRLLTREPAQMKGRQTLRRGFIGEAHFHSFTLGSSATVTRSAIRFTPTVASANTSTTPCTTM